MELALIIICYHHLAKVFVFETIVKYVCINKFDFCMTDLIKGAIFDSGTAVGPLAYPPKGQVVRNTKKLAEFLNCPTSSSSEMIDCMRKIDVKHLVEQDFKFIVS